jgi:murein DD-endopeptidase MepM/ murein hydrolase activator NlpD
MQGGAAIVYLNEPATSATARFQDRQYPMLHDGRRWWTVIGTGALAAPGLHPVSVTYTPEGQTASRSTVQSITVTRREFPVERIDLDPQTSALLAPDVVQAELAQRRDIYSAFTAQRLWSGPFQAPSRGQISDIFGVGRSYNGAPVIDYHRGTDFSGSTGDPVFAAAAGRVAFTGQLKVRGGSVVIDHGAGVFTAYHHLSQVRAAPGQMVAAGERIGDVGATGLVTGPHLHWELLVRGVEIDGALWLNGVDIGP